MPKSADYKGRKCTPQADAFALEQVVMDAANHLADDDVMLRSRVQLLSFELVEVGRVLSARVGLGVGPDVPKNLVEVHYYSRRYVTI